MDSERVFKHFPTISVMFVVLHSLHVSRRGWRPLTICFLFFQLSACWSPFFCLSLLGRVREFWFSISVSHYACPSKRLPLSKTVERDSEMVVRFGLIRRLGRVRSLPCIGGRQLHQSNDPIGGAPRTCSLIKNYERRLSLLWIAKVEIHPLWFSNSPLFFCHPEQETFGFHCFTKV